MSDAVLASKPALTQIMQHPSGAAMHRIQEPYSIETFGMFRNMLLTGDFTPKVKLATVMAKHPTTGVGAVADARGEITIYDGKLIVSYGKAGETGNAGEDSASLLAIGNPRDWQTVRVERDVGPSEIEGYLSATAKAHGIDPKRSGLTAMEIAVNIFGRRQYYKPVHQECRRLVEAGRLKRLGEGGQGSPFTYYLPDAT